MRRGFTLIEALASSALAALLMLAGVSVIASLGRSRATLTRDESRTDVRGVVEMIRFDLANARRIKARPNHVTLTGFGGLDERSLAPHQRPVRITYILKKTGSQTWLVREQVELNTPANGNRWTELICAGVETFSIEPIEGSGALTAKSRAEVLLPSRVRLLIVPAVPNGPNISETIVLQ